MQPTRLHINAHRFMVRRLENALVRRDVSMLDEPLRAQARSLAVGCLLACIALAAGVAAAYLRPAARDAPIVLVKDSGSMFVRIDDTLHPVLNLASARLIAGTPANPALIAGSELAKSKRGALLGIPGAPTALHKKPSAAESQWSVCDGPTGTTVIAGAGNDVAPLGLVDSGRMVLVRSREGGTTYLLYDGLRARVSRGDRSVERALRLDGVEPKTVASAVLNAIPEAPPIASPRIPGAGLPGPAALGGLAVGTVVRVHRAAGDEHYVVLRQGAQRVGIVAADVIRFADSQLRQRIVTVAADAISATAVVSELPVTAFPRMAGRPETPTVVCARWTSTSNGADTAILAGNAIPLRADRAPVVLAQADGSGPNLDAVFVEPGRMLYVHGAEVNVVTDTGVRFAIRDDATARTLGLPASPVEAPWQILRLLPEGPQLSKDNALVAHDAVLPGGGCVGCAGAVRSGVTPPR